MADMAVNTLLLLAWGVVSSVATVGSFRFASSFGDKMVLQQLPSKTLLWGFGNKSTSVTVESNDGSKVTTTVKEDGTWMTVLPGHVAGETEYSFTAVSTGVTIGLKGVLYGDVWVCGGQSNMQFTVDSAFNATAEVAAADHFPMIRLMTPALAQSPTPLTDFSKIEQPWSVASHTSVGGGNWTYFSATCWFYGRGLYEQYKYPIGLVASNWGGTPDEAWSSPDALKKCYKKDTGVTGPHGKSVLWNAMIVPLLHTPIKGSIWYQGEADSVPAEAALYNCTFPAMIADWRAKWHTGTAGQTDATFPFGFVQLAPWGDKSNSTVGCPPVVRWGQTAGYGSVPNARLEKVFMAVAADLGDPTSPFGDIHPRYKQQVGARLVKSARAVAYGEKDVYYTGPLISKVTAVGSDVKVDFTNVGSHGIEVKNGVGFELCGVNCSWTDAGTWVVAHISSSDSNSLTLHPSVLGKYNMLRYQWRESPCMPLVGPYNCAVYAKAEGLPLPPWIATIE